MVKELLNIPERLRAIEYVLPVEKPKIELCLDDKLLIVFRDVSIPAWMAPRFLRQCGLTFHQEQPLYELADKIQDALADKKLILRGKLKENEIQWFGVVTDEFKPVYPRDVHAVLQETFGDIVKVRHFGFFDAVHLEYPVDSAVPGLNVHVNTGAFGLYGGNARTSLRTGLSWLNAICKNWTIFLEEYLWENLGQKNRVVHRGDQTFYENALPGKLLDVQRLIGHVVEEIEKSKSIKISREQLQDYLSLYAGRGANKKIQDAILEKAQGDVSLYDVAYQMTELCQRMTRTDNARAKVEYLAGELILCHSRIFS